MCGAAAASRQIKRTALHWAAFYGYAPCIESLLKAGADTSLEDEVCEWTALHCARINDHTEVVLLLDPAGPLIMAAYLGDFDILSDALAKGVNVNATNDVSAAPLAAPTPLRSFAHRPRCPPPLLPRPRRRR